MKFFVLIFAFVFISAVAGKKIQNYTDCAGNALSTGTITQLLVEPCESEPCQLPRGTDVSLEVTFKPKFASHQLTGKVTGIVSGVPVPFPLPDPDGCRSIGCPTEAGDVYIYKEGLPIEKFYPKVTATVKWQLYDGNKEVWCFSMVAKIV